MLRKKPRKRTAIEAGEVLLVRRRDGDPPETFDAVVESVRPDGLVVQIRGREVSDGEVLTALRTVPGDARYEAQAELQVSEAGDMMLRILADWRRVQQRNFVRVSTYGIAIQIGRQDSYTPTEQEHRLNKIQKGLTGNVRKPTLADVSAGGLRFESAETFRLGERLDLRFTLPGSGPMSLVGRVARIDEADERSRLAHMVGVEFEDANESTRVKITTWVFAEQARRFRDDQTKKRTPIEVKGSSE